MKARLVRLDGDQAHEVARLARESLSIGRDPSCDVVVESARVSRTHARIESSGGAHHLVDLDSANGTRLRGRALVGRARLVAGDEFGVADEAQFRYERVRVWPWRSIAAVAALAIGALVGHWAFDRDPVWERALHLAGEAVEADARRDYAVARQRLKSAVGLLLREGRLDDVPRRDVVEVAMARLGEGLGDAPNLESLFERSSERSAPVPAPEPECRLDRVSPDHFERCLGERIEQVMLDLRQDPRGVPAHFRSEVARRLASERDFLERALPRGRSYRAMMIGELERSFMPPLLHYIACIESGYQRTIRSRAGARGLWQFMPATARDYGLRVDGSRDDRTDPQRSTRAAARYLRALAFEFGGESLMLVLASYNRGENAVRRALKRLEDPYSDRSYWALVEAGYLPPETAEYVSRFVAAAVAGEGGLPSASLLRSAGY